MNASHKRVINVQRVAAFNYTYGILQLCILLLRMHKTGVLHLWCLLSHHELACTINPGFYLIL